MSNRNGQCIVTTRHQVPITQFSVLASLDNCDVNSGLYGSLKIFFQFVFNM